MAYEANLVTTFLAVSFITVATPGPSTLFVIRQAGLGGLPSGMAAVIGILVADAAFLMAGALGIGAALAAAPQALEIIKLIGAGYFLYLAFKMAAPHLRLSASAGRLYLQADLGSPAVARTKAEAGGMRRAFLMHIVNTKALIFFGLLVPQFIHADQSFVPQIAVLLALHLGLAATILGAYAVFGAAMLATSSSGMMIKALDLLGAVVMLVLSGGILLSAWMA